MRTLAWIGLVVLVQGCCSPRRALPGHSTPLWLAPHPAAQGSDVLFAAKDCQNGMELWRQVGLAPATLVEDIDPATKKSSYPKRITRLASGKAYFSARTPDKGREPYHFNGATSNLIADVRPGVLGSDPRYFTRVGSRVLMSLDDGSNGRELWSTDGTATGTTIVADINTSPGKSSAPAEFVRLAGRLVFAATNTEAGRELWISDGTSGGTIMVKDIQLGAGSSAPSNLEVWRGEVWFSADDGVNGRELWRSDGTNAGTVMVKDLAPGADHANPQEISAGNLRLAFSARDGSGERQLFVIDIALNITKTSTFTQGWTIREVVAFDGEFVFTADDPARGVELFRTDGNFVVIARDIHPGTLGSHPRSLTVFTDGVVFRADDGLHGPEPWIWDGSTTRMISDHRPGADGSRPAQFKAAGVQWVAFTADDGVNGIELCRTDGITVQCLSDMDDWMPPLPEGRVGQIEAVGVDIRVEVGVVGAVPGSPIRAYHSEHIETPTASDEMRGVWVLGDPVTEIASGVVGADGTWSDIGIKPNVVSAEFHGFQFQIDGSVTVPPVIVCNGTQMAATINTGTKVEVPPGEGCVDDKGQEYDISAHHLSGPDGWVALVWYNGETGQRQLAPLMGAAPGDPRPIGPGEIVRFVGLFDFEMPLYPDEPGGNKLELWLFDTMPDESTEAELPTEENPACDPAVDPMCRVWRSYC